MRQSILPSLIGVFCTNNWFRIAPAMVWEGGVIEKKFSKVLLPPHVSQEDAREKELQ